MAEKEQNAVMTEEPPRDSRESGAREQKRTVTAPRAAGRFRPYKPEQGKTTRTGTFVGGGAIIAWGAWFLYERLQIFEGDEAWRLLITAGIPIAFAALAGAVAWWFVFSHRSTSDFMIATEGEMKKVSWSSRAEIVGSTKVVIMFTVLMALLLFLVDLFFQFFFSSLGVLKT